MKRYTCKHPAPQCVSPCLHILTLCVSQVDWDSKVTIKVYNHREKKDGAIALIGETYLDHFCVQASPSRSDCKYQQVTIAYAAP